MKKLITFISGLVTVLAFLGLVLLFLGPAVNHPAYAIAMVFGVVILVCSYPIGLEVVDIFGK